MAAGRRIRVLELRSVRGTGGGPEKTILLGAAQADRSRFDIVVCYIRDMRDTTFTLADRARALGVDYVEVDERHSFDRRILAALRRIIREKQIDIVHAHEYKTDLLALLLGRRSSVVPFATAHGWTGQSARERFVYYPSDKWLLGRYRRVIAVSTDIKNELVRFGARPERITVVLNGIDPALFRRDPSKRLAARQSLGLGESDVVIGAVGRVERQKRFDLLLEAVAPIMAAHERVHLAVIGDGTLLADLAAHASRLGIGHRCRFAGHRQDVADLHSAFDLFAQSSEYEGTPNAVLEAMALETPTVATAAGGTAELAVDGRDALIVAPGDVAGLRHSLSRLLDSPSFARQLATSARERVVRDLSFEARTRRLEGLYLEAVGA